MQKKNIFQNALLFIAVLFLVSACGDQKDNAFVKVDWSNFMSKQDMTFDTLTTYWDEGMFLGNGLLGTMIYMEDSASLRFEMGRTDITDHRPDFGSYYGTCRLPIGQFVLKPVGKIKKMHFRLDLWNAEAKGTIVTDQGSIQLQIIVAARQDMMVLKAVTSGKENAFSWDFAPEKSESPRLKKDKNPPEGYRPNPDPIISKEGNINTCYQPLLAGGGYTTAWQDMTNNNKRTIYFTITKGYQTDNSRAKAVTEINQASHQSFQDLVKAHRKWWHQIYQQSFISIPDRRLESFWWIQQYKMIAATRPDALPIDLMGPWYRHTPWPKYWWNLNAQLTYYPFLSSNRIARMMPLFRAINKNLPNLINNVPEQYRYNAAALGRSSSLDMKRSVEVTKEDDGKGSPSSLEMADLPWLLNLYWEAYRYTMNDSLEQTLFPVLKRSINYYLDVLKKGPDGKLHLPYSYSPEYPGGITRDCNYDLSCLRWGCETLLKINSNLELHDSLATRWQSVLQNLTPYPTDSNGLMIGRDVSFKVSHRHYSHLLMIYPLHLMSWRSPKDRPLIERSLKHWQSMPKAWRGYSYSGSAAIYATMGDGDEALRRLDTLMNKFIKPNTMYIEAGPVIETPLSAVTTMNEMLLQSWGGILDIFPAVPTSWKAVSFYHLRGEGAFLLSAVRKNGETQFIRIKSLAGSPCMVKADLGKNFKVKSSREIAVKKKAGGLLEIALKKGDEITLYRGSYQGDFSITPVNVTKGENNSWGLHQ
jgi:hypothetical protein